MSAGGYLDACGFIPVSAGTGNFVVSAAVTGYQTPASAGAVNAVVYSYRAENPTKTEWEEGFGAYTVGTTTLARTTITANSSGGTTAFSFTAAPNVYITALSADLQNASLLANGTVAQARLGSGSAGAGAKFLADDQTYKAITVNGTVSVVAYTSTQTITIPTGATRALVRLWGASGGGGSSSLAAGGGGGGAGYLDKYLTGLTAANTLALTIGAAGTITANANGGLGGNSTLASGTQTISTLTANGGAGGGGAGVNGLAGGAGGTASGGDFNITGQKGGFGASDVADSWMILTVGGMSGGGRSVGGNGGAGGNGTVGIIGGCLIEWYS